MFYHDEVFDDKARLGISLARRTGRWKLLKVMGDVIQYSNYIDVGKKEKLKKWKNLHIVLMNIYWNVLKVWNYVTWLLQLPSNESSHNNG